ncbi:hypothetical protein DYD21_13225 [Rhodohalobacter sp. SW132]|uniref:hypothetical protein n=1 Tax=Rhodohalobacter sp. SW132 TaxID=2293433 RepID=UPI000E266C81|nr:hypothetical protein [Rhodohalobacter sp. SW132]REL33209.1 hypothetical protein DYD21_13225 [Rhodohalobacter sp. SW132]
MTSLKNKLLLNTHVIPADFWNVSKAGKTLEFSVTAHIDINPADYRQGVIQIGQIIRRIEQFARVKNAAPKIQLFPNLAEDQLAATVFWPELLSGGAVTLPKKQPGCLPPPSKIQSIAKVYRFTLKKTDQDKGVNSNKWVVCSSSNQPFIWLKLGQFIEHLSETDKGITIGNLADLIEILEPEGQKQKTDLYTQLAIYIP